MARLIWALAAIPVVALSAEQPTPEEIIEFPYAPPHWLLKTSWLQGLAEQFSNYIDVLSLQFSAVLGSWSREPLFLAITPAKILLLLFTVIIGFALAGLARVVILRYHSLGRTKPITERYWRNGILFALRRALSGFFIFTGAFFASVPILPHIGLALGGFPTFAIAAKFAELGYFATALGFCFRIARLVQNWLNTLAKSPSNRWYFAAFPVLGKALNYNLILFAFSAAIYILELPAPLQRAGYTIVAIAWIVANDVLLIQKVFGSRVDGGLTGRDPKIRCLQAAKARDSRSTASPVADICHRARRDWRYPYDLPTGAPDWNRAAGIRGNSRGYRWVRCSEIAFNSYCRTPDRDLAAHANRGRGDRRGRVGNNRRDHFDLRCDSRVGPAAFDRSNQLFSGKAIPELDPQQFGPNGRGVPLC